MTTPEATAPGATAPGATAPDGRDRRLNLRGAVNFRDLGGYAAGPGRRTRWGVMWRADSLSDLTADDLDVVGTLGLHTLIDFRISIERARRPNRLPPGSAVRTVDLGFLPSGTLDLLRAIQRGTIDAAGVEHAILGHYRALPVVHANRYRAMFARIERAGGRPVLIHCASGKDRTGFGAAMILLALGASRATALADYTLSDRYRRDIGHLFPPGTPAGVMEALTAAPPQYLEAALATIDRAHGSVDAYLERALGLTPARRQRLRDQLTEAAAAGETPAEAEAEAERVAAVG